MSRHTTRSGRAARAVASVAAAALIVPAVAIAPASASPVAPSATVLTQRDSNVAHFEERILVLLNDDRAEMGLPDLQRVVELDTVARDWSARQASDQHMRHNPSYSDQYPRGWVRAAENVAMGYRTPEAMYQAWYNSPGHYRNMFNPDLTHIGVGVAYADNGAPYGTQNFATYPGSTSQLTPTHPAPTPERDDYAPTIGIDDGGIGGGGNEYHLNTGEPGDPARAFRYGTEEDRVYVGDWDGDGTDTLAYRVGSSFYIRDRNSAGEPTQVIHYGRPGDRVYVGDWDGDGTDTFAVRRGKEYHFKDSIAGGEADHVIRYGRSGDTVLVGDWDGDGTDTLGVRRGSIYHLKNSIAGGEADHVVNYGRENDAVLAGDWDGDGTDSLAVRRGAVYHFKNSIRGGEADSVLQFGNAETDTPLTGDWTGEGFDRIGIRR